jgi:hypothetical protein
VQQATVQQGFLCGFFCGKTGSFRRKQIIGEGNLIAEFDFRGSFVCFAFNWMEFDCGSRRLQIGGGCTSFISAGWEGKFDGRGCDGLRFHYGDG